MQVHIAVRLVANCYTPSTLLYTNQSIDPLLVALHAVAGVDHNKLSSVVNAALVTPDLTFGTQHPELTNSHNNNMLISWEYTMSSLLSKSWNQSTDFIITNIPTRYMYLSFHTIACFKSDTFQITQSKMNLSDFWNVESWRHPIWMVISLSTTPEKCYCAISQPFFIWSKSDMLYQAKHIDSTVTSFTRNKSFNLLQIKRRYSPYMLTAYVQLVQYITSH